MKTLFITLSVIGFLFSSELKAIYLVDGMMCAKSCVKKVNESLDDLEGIKSYKVDFGKKMTTVVYDDEIINSDQIAQIIIDNTYFKVKERKKPTTFWDWLFGKK